MVTGFYEGERCHPVSRDSLDYALSRDLEEFVHDHRSHGPLTADGYRASVERLLAHSGLSVWGGV